MPNQGRILVVDDTPATLYSTARVLKRAGFDVIEATTGTEALERADDSVDLVVLDVQLPDIHGFEVCRQIRARDTTALIPVVHLSATFKTDIDRAQGLDAGADGYLTHPVEPIVLVATINTLLRARHAEEEQRRTEEQFTEVFQDAPISICILDPGGAVVEANPAMCRLVGRVREDILGKHLRDFAVAEFRTNVDVAFDTVTARGEWRGWFPLQRADGSSADVDWRIKAPQRSKTWLTLAVDVTQQRRYEIEREQLLAKERAARDEAERVNRLKDQFIAVLGHELRNPLAAIATGIELLKSGTIEGEKQSWVHNSIERQTAQLTSLINDLIDTTRITHGKVTLNKRPIQLDSVVNDAVESCGELIERGGHRLTISMNPPDIVLEADPLRLEQIVINLLTNAARYTPAGGDIKLETVAHATSLELSVTDTGIGLSEQDILHIFEPFAQIGTPGQGLGIGLTLVRQLVELHGGTIGARSGGPGLGSTFHVSLPLVSTELPGESKTVEHGPAEVPVRVLIVDDNQAVALMLQMLLRDSRYSTEVAFTGESALEVARRFKPELVLLDIGLPDISGYDVAERLRNEVGADLTIAAVSGYSHEEARMRVRQANFDAHFIKPVSAGQVHELVESTVLRRNAEAKL